MSNREIYLEDFKEVEEILRAGLNKNSASEPLKKLHAKNTNMFLYTVELMTKVDMIQEENRLLYEKLRDKTIEVENLKLTKK
jgi:hypothetical protein